MNVFTGKSAFPLQAARLAALLALAQLSACASLAEPTCGPGQQRFTNEMLYFGTDTPDGEVTAEDWQGFVEDVVTPRFPQGLTAWPAYGQWRMNTGEIIQEGSYVLSLLHAGEAERNTAVIEIMEAYKLQFQQEAVLRVQSPVCVSF
jgi:hypothetical protein